MTASLSDYARFVLLDQSAIRTDQVNDRDTS